MSSPQTRKDGSCLGVDSQPLLDHRGKLKLGSQLAVSYDNVLQHKKAIR